jgi:hypothetical protein
MDKSIAASFIFATVIGLAASCERRAKQKWEKIEPDPIGAIGHGVIKDSEGKELKVDEALIARVQKIYLNNLSSPELAVREGGRLDSDQITRTQNQIFSIVGDRILANALLIEKLIEQRKPQDEARYSTVNNALRWYYVLNLQKNPILPDAKFRWGKGLKDDEATKLESAGMVVFSVTNKRMPEYCDECVKAGVPVPANMFGKEWTNLGTFDGEEFISPSGFPELMIYVSGDPEGFCLALPRYLDVSGSAPDGSSAGVFGVICLGTRTSKACFFDNPKNRLFRKNDVIDFRSNFVGGTDLVLNAQGTCTDCHAGENPFIIHPDKKAFAKIWDNITSTQPARWHDPLVEASWPQNPGPTHILDGVPSDGRCNSCHQQGSAGRFPRMSYPLPGYCSDVFMNAVRPRSAGGTMPRPPDGTSEYSRHINALKTLCENKSFPGEIEQESHEPDPSFVSRPIVLGPLYACATAVAVRGAVLDAKVSLLIDGIEVATISPARSPYEIHFQNLPALTAGQVVTAIQQSEGAASQPSDPVAVKNHQEDYPDGLPKPIIDPTRVYQCASLIAVQHVPGAILVVTTNGGDPRITISSWHYTAVRPSGAPFALNDEFIAEQSLCGEWSAPSAPVRAIAPPSAALPFPTFNPPNFINGQELLLIENIVGGAEVTLRETGLPWTGSFSTPINWMPDYDIKSALGRPLKSDDALAVTQALCIKEGEWSPDQKVHECEQMPAPLIETPIAGNTFVIVAQSQPGARVMIYDSGDNEIGDGSGTVVPLNRAIVAGEELTAVQRIGECTGRFVYKVPAGRGKK